MMPVRRPVTLRIGRRQTSHLRILLPSLHLQRMQTQHLLHQQILQHHLTPIPLTMPTSQIHLPNPHCTDPNLYLTYLVLQLLLLIPTSCQTAYAEEEVLLRPLSIPPLQPQNSLALSTSIATANPKHSASTSKAASTATARPKFSTTPPKAPPSTTPASKPKSSAAPPSSASPIRYPGSIRDISIPTELTTHRFQHPFSTDYTAEKQLVLNNTTYPTSNNQMHNFHTSLNFSESTPNHPTIHPLAAASSHLASDSNIDRPFFCIICKQHSSASPHSNHWWSQHATDRQQDEWYAWAEHSISAHDLLFHRTGFNLSCTPFHQNQSAAFPHNSKPTSAILTIH